MRELSRSHGARHLARSLDLLHVAAARATRCDVLVTADDRQVAVAKSIGLRVKDLKRARSTRPR
jgi:hypothetical protein